MSDNTTVVDQTTEAPAVDQTTEAPAVDTPETLEAAPAAPVQLQLADLMVALEIINVASARGAFKPEEFQAIGGCYDRIRAFLIANGASEAPSESPNA